MARVKRGVTTRAKHKRLLEQAAGYRGRRKNTIRVARQAVEKAHRAGVALEVEVVQRLDRGAPEAERELWRGLR